MALQICSRSTFCQALCGRQLGAAPSGALPACHRWWREPVANRRASSSFIVRNRYEAPNIPECNFAEKVMQNWKSFGNKPAIVEAGTNRSYTYAQLSEAVKRTGSALRRLGFKANDVMCMFIGNNPEFPIMLYSVMAIGGTPTPVNPLYTKSDLQTTMFIGKVSYMLCHAQNLGTAQEAVASLPNPAQIKKIIVIGDVPKGDKRLISFSALLEDDGSYFDGAAARVDCRDSLACLPFSSGTTGLPKGVMLTHYNLVANLKQIWQYPFFPVKASDTMAAVLPFFHIYGLVVVLSVGLHSGALLVTYPKWDPTIFLSALEQHRVTVLPIVPPILLFMAKDPVTARFDLSSLEHVLSGASPLGTALSKEFLDKFPFVKTLCQGYGLTETSPVTHMNTRDNWRLGSVGELVPGVEAKIVDVKTDDICGPNVEGELLLRGPNVMKGYFENPEANSSVFAGDRWMRTGDIAYYDKDGFFYVVDRVKELIKYKGSQVPPAELEALLLAHPAVRDAAVIGVPDEEAGELPRAYVCLKAGHDLSTDAILTYVAERVAPSKKLRGGVKFISEIPKSASGKILRRVLKAEAVAEQNGLK